MFVINLIVMYVFLCYKKIFMHIKKIKRTAETVLIVKLSIKSPQTVLPPARLPVVSNGCNRIRL